MPRTSEVAINTLFAEVLRRKHSLWRDRLRVEQTGILRDARRARPDILAHVPDTQPVVIETEYDPASTVEDGRQGPAWQNIADAPTFSKQHGGSGVAVGDGFHIHGNDYIPYPYPMSSGV